MPPRRQATTTNNAPITRTRSTRSAVAAEPPEPKTRRVQSTSEALAARMASRLKISDDKGKEREREGETTTRAQTSRVPSRSQAKPVKKDVEEGVEGLTEMVERKLVIEDRKAVPSRVKSKSREEICTEAMLAVNAASKKLSAIIQSGWKSSESADSTKASSKKHEGIILEVETQSAAIREGLAMLREHRPGNVDVERAACSAVGKLVSLESYQSALPILRDMSTALPSYYPYSPSEAPPLDTPLDLPFLHLPSSPIPSGDETLLNLLGSFLLYSLITTTYTLFTQLGLSDSASSAAQSLHDFAHHLHHPAPNRATLLQWLPILQQNSTSTSIKHLDGTLTRAYTALVKASSLPPQPSTAYILEQSSDIFRIRLYALLLLSGTSSGTIKPTTFWEQCVKFSAAYVKSVLSATSKHASNSDSESEVKREVTQVILDAFDVISRYSEKRVDRGEWMKGEGFVTWCEYWMDFAKRVGNPETVKKISKLIKSTTSSSHENPSPAAGSSRSNPSRPGISTLQAANICATLAQTTAHLDQPDSSELDETAIQESLRTISQSEPYLLFVFGSADGDASLEKAGTKVWRALERLRRVALKVFETTFTSSKQPGTVETLTRKIVDVLSNVLSFTEMGHTDLLTSILDSLFSLAKSPLNPSKPHSIDSSFQFLHKGLTLVNASPDSPPPLERANFLRCISGAFHNLGATLYQAGHHSHAVRFFEKSCGVGEDALRVYATTTGESDKSEEKEGQWRTLEEQVYRRWEILGVCYSKTGDRKAAYEAFRNCIAAYPFHSFSGATPTLLERAGTCSPITLWDGSPSAKHIASVVDRMTYTGVCDLLLPIEEVSLKSWSPRLPNGLNNLDGFSVVGALLERQVESLESSKWKPVIQSAMGKLLQDTMKVYGRQKMPIRKARVIIKCLELASTANGKGPCIVDDIEDYALEADGLLQVTDLGPDTGLAGFCAQYRAALKLRLAHLMHQQMPTSQSSNSRIVAYVEGACSILKGILSPLPRQSLAGPSSPLASKSRGTRRATGKRQATVSKTTSTRTRGRTAKVASALPVTPKAKPRKSMSAMPQSPLPRLSFGVPSTLECAPALLDLLQSTAHLLGLLGDIVKKVQVLAIGRRISEQYLESRPDDYIKFSTEVAHEYVNLGKTSKAASIYAHTWNAMHNNLRVSDESRVLFLLRYSESLISLGNVLKSSTSYTEAYSIAQAIDVDEKSLPSALRVLTRAALLERAAVAATTFSLIQYTRDDPVASINGLLQSLRLWNRAFDTLSRLAPPSPSKDPNEDNPFLQTESKPASPSTDNSLILKLPGMSGIGWRIAEGLLNTLFSLTRAYVSRGSPREAEFFAQQAKDLSLSLNMPAMVSRAFSRLGEIYLHLGQLEDSHTCLVEAAKLVSDAGGPDAAEIRRLRAEHSRVNENKKDARQLYDEAIVMLEELEQQFTIIDGHVVGKSMELSSKATTTSANETLAPSLLLSILRQNIVMLHAEGGEYQQLLERLRSLPPTAEIKAEESALMAKLKLGDVYGRFQADMFLSSLAESAITLPMGMKRQKNSVSASTQEILSILNQAEKLFWSDLALVAKRGNVFHVRDAAVSLALIKAFQDTLGKTGSDGPTLAASLLDHSTAITLRREVLEVVQYKFGDPNDHNDLQWPLVTPSGSPMSPPKHRKRTRFVSFDSDDEELPETKQSMLATYWQALAKKYQEQPYDSSNLAKPREIPLPANWTVVSISVTEDKNTMFVTRQCANKEPLIFYIPLKERRDSEDEEYLGFDDALAELREIIHLSDEGTKEAANVKSREARAGWWANRSALDTRMKQLLDNIEFCWLGAFKTILSSPKHIPRDALDDLRTRLESIFDRSIVIRDRKQAISISLDDSLMECFANLSPKARDEEFEDLVYFILDLYQFHGFPIATAELDIDQVVIDFRSALEDHAAKYRGRIIPQPDSHMFLVLDKNVQGIPWESIPILRGQSVSRIPSMDFLLDRLRYAKNVRGQSDTPIDRLVVNPRETFFVLNPSGDLKNTEGRFVNWLQDMKQVGWSGIVGKVPSELQFADALIKKDLLIYFGHGGAEQYIRSRKVRHLPRCAATMLWGCSSGELKEMGDFDRAGTPYNYMLAGCPTLVANLWDVTDRDIDKFSQSVFDKMHLTPDAVGAWNLHTAGDQDRTSIVTAVAESRDACKLKYLTGAAPIIYGIPFYL